MSRAQRREMVDREHSSLSIVRQCALLGVSRSSLYYRPRAASEEDLSLMGEIDRQYLVSRAAHNATPTMLIAAPIIIFR